MRLSLRSAVPFLCLHPQTRSALLPPAVAAQARRRVFSPVCAASSASGESPAREFLIANSHNEVRRLECSTPAVVRQGLLETAGLPHICVAGESNAGKSSLINHLLHKKNLARASSVAGKTRSVDMMLVNERVVVADLPGLPSRDHQVAAVWESAWEPLVFDYIRSASDQLCAMLYVHDVRWKVSAQVRGFLGEVAAHDLPVLLVLTKDDKIAGELREPTDRDAEVEARQRYMMRARRAMDFDGVHLHYSVNSDRPQSRKARRRLLRYIESIVGAGSREASTALLAGIADENFRQLG